MLEFELPYLMIAALLPFLMLVLPAAKSQLGQALKVPAISYFSIASGNSEQSTSQRFKWFLAYLAYCGLIFAAMRPIWVGDPINLPLEGRDLMMAIDLSGSMRESDMQSGAKSITRIQATQQVASEFVTKRQGDRIGLIVFGENPYIQTPLTFDLKTIKQHILKSRIGFAGERGTVIGDAIGLAVKRLRESEVKEKILILLTDGVDTGSRIPPLKAAELAASDGLKIYTVGIGSGGQRGLFSRRQEIDEVTLNDIAKLTDGQYFRAKNASELENIYALIDQLEPVESDLKTFKPKTSLFHYGVMTALLFSLLLTGFQHVERKVL